MSWKNCLRLLRRNNELKPNNLFTNIWRNNWQSVKANYNFNMEIQKRDGLHFWKATVKNTRSKYDDNIHQPGHPGLIANKMAQIWNNMNLSNAKSLACTRASAHKWYLKNPKISIWLIVGVIFHILFHSTDVTTNRFLMTSVTF